MRLLLDTHAFVWALTEPERLSPQVRAALEDMTNELLISGVSVAELATKARIGKLSLLTMEVAPFLEAGMPRLRARELAFSTAHGAEIERLPRHHRDPFDRMLIAQARVEGVPLVTDDRRIRLYEVEVLW